MNPAALLKGSIWIIKHTSIQEDTSTKPTSIFLFSIPLEMHLCHCMSIFIFQLPRILLSSPVFSSFHIVNQQQSIPTNVLVLLCLPYGISYLLCNGGNQKTEIAALGAALSTFRLMNQGRRWHRGTLLQLLEGENLRSWKAGHSRNFTNGQLFPMQLLRKYFFSTFLVERHPDRPTISSDCK